MEDLPFPEIATDYNAKEIKTSQWRPDHPPLQYPDEFVEWVDSINSGWQNMTKYKPFELYRKQAYKWLKEEDEITDFHDEDDQLDFVAQEKQRCIDNSLYFCNKYGWLKEGDVEGGGVKYQAWKAQEVILFLADCGYCFMIGKARQIGFTSTLGLLACKRLNFMPSYYTKFITKEKEKGEEIFRDKIRWAFGRIPSWFRENVYNDSHNALSVKEKGKKGETSGLNSMIEVVAPKVDAINGGSPQCTMIDEAGLIDIFSGMMKEGRPTLFFFNPKTKRMEMKRQLLAWGTGGEMDKGGAVYEAEFKACMAAWRERKFNYAIIPLFFDAFAREGMNEEIYNREKEVYYAVQGIESEKSKVQFHQHYPMTMDDMFLRTAKTILPIPKINQHLHRIYQLDDMDKPKYGWFEPVTDSEGNVIKAVFMPSDGMSDPRTSCVIFKEPETNWDYRYYQGTDPINSETGHSKMSSTIWDGLYNTISATVFHRTKHFKESYMQCMLLGLYYDPRNLGARELVESNIGDMYVDWLEGQGYARCIQPSSMLPPFMQTGSGKWWGINNKTNTAGHIANKIIEMCDGFADNIWIPWFFMQLKTFIEKDLKGAQSHRQTRYQAADLRYDYDDVIFSSVFAYICAQCHQKYEPNQVDAADKESRTITKYVQDASTNFRLRLAEVDRVTGKVKRFIENRA